MMKDIIIFGAGGFGREVAWLIERINKVQPIWNLLGFMDDTERIQRTEINGYKVLGKVGDIKRYPNSWFVCAIGASKAREKVIKNMREVNPGVKFGTLIDPSVEISERVAVGKGSIICAHAVITVNVTIGDHVIVNLDCTIGHDAIIKDFVTLYPSVNVSGMTTIGHCCEVGTGIQIIQGKAIGSYSIVGAGAVVVKNIAGPGTYVGVPARKSKGG